MVTFTQINRFRKVGNFFSNFLVDLGVQNFGFVAYSSKNLLSVIWGSVEKGSAINKQ